MTLQEQKDPKIILLAALKGGVGKTNLAFNIAGQLACEGYNVLGIDNDLQGNLSNNCKIDRTNKNLKTLKDVYDTEIEVTLSEVIRKSPIPELPTLDVIPSSIMLHYIELRMGSVSGKEYLLHNFLEDNKDDLKHYDYIIIDTNPSMSAINQNAFIVADSICIVSDMEENALEGVDLFVGLWNNVRKSLRREDNVAGIIINAVDKRETTITSDFIEFIEKPEHEYMKPLLFDNIIPRDVKLKKTSKEKKPVCLLDRECRGYVAIKDLVSEMKERGVL